MQSVQRIVDVNVPAAAAYDAWARFGDLPRFVDGLEHVQRMDDMHLHWRASAGAKAIEGECAVTRQLPNEVIAWRSTAGTPNGGHVRFEPLGPDLTRVTLRIEYDLGSIVEQPGDALGAASRIVERTLGDFKDFIEMRGLETDAWRGDVGARGDTGQRA